MTHLVSLCLKHQPRFKEPAPLYGAAWTQACDTVHNYRHQSSLDTPLYASNENINDVTSPMWAINNSPTLILLVSGEQNNEDSSSVQNS